MNFLHFTVEKNPGFLCFCFRNLRLVYLTCAEIGSANPWAEFRALSKHFMVAVWNIWDHPFKTSAICRGGGVKNWPNLPTDSSKKLPTEGGGEGSKIVKICRRLKWMVPNWNPKAQNCEAQINLIYKRFQCKIRNLRF